MYRYNLTNCRVILSGPVSQTIMLTESPLILDPHNYIQPDVSASDPIWADWQFDLIIVGMQTQRGECICGRNLNNFPSSLGKVELHHAVISRRDAMGIYKQKRPFLLHHSCNVVAVHSACHANLARGLCIEFLEQLYGEAVRKWYDDLDMRHKPDFWSL